MIKRALFWAAFPWVIPQALWIKRTAPRFAGAAGNDKGSTGDGESLSLLVVGDSIAAGVGADTFTNALVGQLSTALSERYNCRVDWKAVGKIGATTRVVLDELVPAIPESAYDLIVVSTGVNDVTALTRVTAFATHLEDLIVTLHAQSPGARIVAIGLPPMHQFPLLPQPLRSVIGLRSRLLDEAVRRVAERHSYAVHIPVAIAPDPELFAADGYHPSPKGYEQFGDAVVQGLGCIRPGSKNEDPACEDR